MNSLLFLRCGLRGYCSETLPCVSSWIRRPQQSKHFSSCVVQLCHKFPCADFQKKSTKHCCCHRNFQLSKSIFHDASSSGTVKKIPRNLLALSSFGFSMAHFCFSLRFAASDICFHISGHTLSGLEVVCFLVNLPPGPCISIKCPPIQYNESCETCPCIWQLCLHQRSNNRQYVFLRYHI